jgi:hypothetical protein
MHLSPEASAVKRWPPKEKVVSNSFESSLVSMSQIWTLRSNAAAAIRVDRFEAAIYLMAKARILQDKLSLNPSEGKGGLSNSW